MSDSQAYKNYIKKLASSGLPACKARLEMLAGMDRSEAFQWYQENKLHAPAIVALAPATPKRSKVASFLAYVSGEPTEQEAKLAPLVDVLAADPVIEDEEVYDFSAKYPGLKLHNNKPLIGSTFVTTKSLNTFRIIAAKNGRIDAVKVDRSAA